MISELQNLCKGYIEDEMGWRCGTCGALFERGQVYRSGERFLEAARAARDHAETAHGDRLKALLAPGKDGTGLTDLQTKVLAWTCDGLDDREIARRLGVSESTVRNHRFQTKRRAREALRLVAIAELARRSESTRGAERPGDAPVRWHAGLTVSDERTDVTVAEEEAILAKYRAPGETFAVSRMPKKEKEKLVILKRIAGLFEEGREYRENEVNEILSRVHADYASLRRYLVDYGFVSRETDCSSYRLNPR